MLPVLAAREVSRRGGGARRGSEAPDLMSPAGAKSKRSGRSDVLAGHRGRLSNPAPVRGVSAKTGFRVPGALGGDVISP